MEPSAPLGLTAGHESVFAEIVGRASDAIVIVDGGQNIALINQGAEDIFGYAASEVIGRPLDILIPADWVEVHRRHVRDFSRGRESARYMHQRREVLGRRKDGEIFPAEASIVKVSGGEKNLFAAILRDVSERREVESLHEKFSHAIEQAGDIVFITDGQGVIEYVNPAFEQVTGYDRQEALGKTPRILKSGMMSDEYYQWVWGVILSGEVARAETLNRKKNGELFYYDQTISPLKDSRGRVTHFVSTGKDVTAHRRMEREVQLLLKLTLGVAEAESFDAALAVTLQLVCETMHWDFGEVWVPSYDGSCLEMAYPYYGNFEGLERFRQASAGFNFPFGAGLPGKVWRLGQPVWTSDVTEASGFMRAAHAKEAGLKSAVGIPVMAENQVVAVLEFFSRTPRARDERMMALSSAITAQLGAAFQRKKMDELLKQSEARLREAQRIAKIGNWDLDLRKNRLIWSDEIFRIFEIDKGKFQASYEAFLELVHPEDREAVNRAYVNSLADRQPYQITHRLLMPDGRIKYVEERCENFFAADGTPIRSVGLVQDITERALAEKALRASEEQYRTIIQTATDGYWLVDARGVLLDVNESYCKMSGYDRRELIGMSIPDLEAYETREETVAHIRHVAAAGEDRFQSKHRRKDGGVFDVEISVQYKEMNGGRFVAFLRDITESRKAEQRLRESEKKWKSLFAILPVGVSIVDGQEMTDMNPALADILDLTRDEMTAGIHKQRKYLNAGGEPLSLDEFPSARAMREGAAIQNFEIGVVKTEKDHSVIWVDVSAAPLSNTSCVVVTTDVTERKRAEEALRISEEKYRMVANFTYDWEAWRGPDGRYLYVSPACERIAGHAVEEFMTDPDLVLKIIHPGDAHILLEHRREVQAQTLRKALETEYRIIARDGQVRWINHTCVPVFGDTGEFLGRRENNRDVTERKLAEFALRDSQQRLREMVDAAPFGAHVFQLQEDGRLVFIDANESADAIFGVNHSAFLGKTFEEAFAHLVRSELPQAYRRVARTGARYTVPRFHYKDKRLSATLEIHAMQIAPNRVASFFRNISELEIAYDETIVGWSRAMDLRDNETEEHTARVTKMTMELSRIMGFSETELLYVRWGALLHDMGKIGVPDRILRKPDMLTEEEWAIMRRHPEFAYQMLNPIRFLRPALDIPYCHHERWDGSGYPRGLKGVEIPLAARIFALVDVWDALRSDRPYRKKWSKQKTVEHIRSLAGVHFDPALMDVFLDFVQKKRR